ncbi:phosphatase PAP2 family protein [Streptomyces sp. NPDC048275]|uniref:phosphatase PAP2 family protein n=1 Tax=Streptomyces sp. NPDC048275 TaxID=3155629 RepID=UPI0033FAD1BC
MRPLDRLTLGYLSVAAVVAAAGPGPVHDRGGLLVGFCGCAVLVLACAGLARRRPTSRLAGCAGVGCALALTLFLYPAIGRYALVLQGRFLDEEVNAWEARVFGVHPNLALDAFTHPALTEFMMATYFSFYLFAALPPLWLAFHSHAKEAESYLFRQMLAVYLCYLGFLLVPLQGPAYSLQDQFEPPSLTGYSMTELQTYIMTRDPAGACFPSAHVATSWAGFLAMRRILPAKVSLFFLPLVLCITVSVVYNRYHYLSDALAGIAVALLAHFLATAFDSRPLFPASFPYRSSHRGHLRKMP